MRILLLFLALTVCTSLSHAQEQERKLADRLLRPDMTLINSAQGRKFIGAEAIQMDKKLAAKSFQACRQTDDQKLLRRKGLFRERFSDNEIFARRMGCEHQGQC